MNNLLSTIEEIINKEYKYENSTHLVEPKTNANASTQQCESVQIKKRGKALIYKFDEKTDQLLSFLNSIKTKKSSSKAMLDYIIFYEKQNYYYILLCNLKSHNISNSHDQIHAGHLLAQYLVGTANRLLDIPIDKQTIYIALHFKTNAPSNEVPTKQPPSYEYYKNGLPYLILPCKYACNLDAICHQI